MQFKNTDVIISLAVTLIAVRREVAALDRINKEKRVFTRSECQVLDTDDKSLYVISSAKLAENNRCEDGLKNPTHTGECTVTACLTLEKCEKEATFFMANQVMRITLKAYDHQLVDQSAQKIIETVKKNGSQVSGPVPLPTKREVVTILRAVHKYKDSREQFEQRTHKRLIDIIAPTQKTVDVLSRLEMPAGVYIDIKMKEKK